MKFFILLAIFSLALVADAKRIKKLKCGPVSVDSPCPAGMVWALGDTPECDTTICRGAAPYCQDPPVQVFGCRCSDPNTKKDGLSCVKQCPLYPSAPPGGGPGGPDMYPSDPEVPESICPVGQQLVQVPTFECDMKRCRGDPPPKYCQFSSETLMACRCISGHYDHGNCVERCPRYPHAPPPPPPGRKNPHGLEGPGGREDANPDAYSTAAPALICPPGQIMMVGSTYECDMNRCRGDPPPPYCPYSLATETYCRCTSGHYDYGTCVEECPLYGQEPPTPPPTSAGSGRPQLSDYEIAYPMLIDPILPEDSFCPVGMTWEEGPTWDCDNAVCRGAMPVCQDEAARVFDCFCTDKSQSKDGSACVEQCPLYPQLGRSPEDFGPIVPGGPDLTPAPPGGGEGGVDPDGPGGHNDENPEYLIEVPVSICPPGQIMMIGPTWECDKHRCRGDPPPGYCPYSSATETYCRCISGREDGDTCVAVCPRYGQEPPTPPPTPAGPAVSGRPQLSDYEIAYTMPIDPILVDPMPEDSICPAGMTWEEGPTSDCDRAICRGNIPVCQDEAARVFGCFCTDKSQSQDVGGCVSQCPLYPSAPPRKGFGGDHDIMYA